MRLRSVTCAPGRVDCTRQSAITTPAGVRWGTMMMDGQTPRVAYRAYLMSDAVGDFYIESNAYLSGALRLMVWSERLQRRISRVSQLPRP